MFGFFNMQPTLFVCVFDGLYLGDSDITRRRCVFGVENPERHNCVCDLVFVCVMVVLLETKERRDKRGSLPP